MKYSRPECHLKCCEDPAKCKRLGVCHHHYRHAEPAAQPESAAKVEEIALREEIENHPRLGEVFRHLRDGETCYAAGVIMDIIRPYIPSQPPAEIAHEPHVLQSWQYKAAFAIAKMKDSISTKHCDVLKIMNVFAEYESLANLAKSAESVGWIFTRIREEISFGSLLFWEANTGGNSNVCRYCGEGVAFGTKECKHKTDCPYPHILKISQWVHLGFIRSGKVPSAIAAPVTPVSGNGPEPRIAELEALLRDEIGWYATIDLVCQKGLMERCQCAKCRRERIEAALGAQLTPKGENNG